MNTKKILSLILACCLLVGMVPAALANEGDETPTVPPTEQTTPPVEPTEPVQPTDPVESTDPVQPTEPVEPTDPVNDPDDLIMPITEEPAATAKTVATIGKNTYGTLKAAIDAAIGENSPGTEITLTADASVTEKISITKDVTIDGANHTVTGVTANAGVCFEITGGTVTVKNMTLTKFGDTASTSTGTGVFKIPVSTEKATAPAPKLVAENLTINHFNRGAFDIRQGELVATNCTIDCDNKAEKRLNKGFVLGYDTTSKVTATITGCIITGSNSTYEGWSASGIEASCGATVTVKDCSITSMKGGISVARNYGSGKADVTVSGTTIDAKDYALRIFESGKDATAVKDSSADLKVESGTYTGDVRVSIASSSTADGSSKIIITGGTYSVDPSAFLEAGKYSAKQTASGKYEVVAFDAGTLNLTTGANLTGISATTTKTADNTYKVEVTGKDVPAGLETFNTTEALKEVYALFAPANGNWASTPATARGGNFTVVTLDFPVGASAKDVKITQQSKALRYFYCAGENSLDSYIAKDDNGITATKTRTYTPEEGESVISLSFLVMEGDKITFTVTHSEGKVSTYTIDPKGIEFQDFGKSTLDNRGFNKITFSTFTPVSGKPHTYEATVSGNVDMSTYAVTDKILQTDFATLLKDPAQRSIIAPKLVKDDKELIFADIDFRGPDGEKLIAKEETTTATTETPADTKYVITQINPGMAYAYSTDNTLKGGIKGGTAKTISQELRDDGMTFILGNPKNTSMADIKAGDKTPAVAKDDVVFQISLENGVTTTLIVHNKLEFGKKPDTPTNVPTVDTTVKVEQDDTTKKSTATATVTEVTEDTMNKAEASGTLVINADKATGVDKVELTLKKDVVNTLADTTAADVKTEIQTPVGTVTLPAEVLDKMKTAIGNENKDAVLTVEKIADPTDGTGAKAIYSVEIKAGGQNVEIGDLNAPITLVFNVGSGRDDNPKLVYVKNGELLPIAGSTYDRESGLLTATTTHLSEFADIATVRGSTVNNTGIGKTITLTATPGRHITVQATENSANVFQELVVPPSGTLEITVALNSTVSVWETVNKPTYAENKLQTGKVIGTWDTTK